MKNILKLLAIALIFISVITLSGCKDQYSVYVFTSSGGYVTINNSNDKISLKEILYCSGETEVTFNANENEGYQFLYWLKDTQIYSTNQSIKLKISNETVVKAIFEKNDSLSITFVNENNNLIIENTIPISNNDIMKNFPAIPQKAGYVGNYYCDNEIMLEGNKYPYTTSKTFVLKYIKQQFNVTTEYKNCTANDLKINLITESFSVDYNGEVKFSITNNTNREYSVALDTTSNEIYANAYGIYTISNIQSDHKIIVKLLSTVIKTEVENNNSTPSEDNNVSNEDDYPEDNNNANNTTNDQNNNQPNQDDNNEFVPAKNQFYINFDKNKMPNLVDIQILTSSKYYDYENSMYYVYKNTSFKFEVSDKNSVVPSNRIVYANNKIIPIKDGYYTLDNVTENITISIDNYYTMVFTIDYGKLGWQYYEDAMDDDSIPLYTAVIEFHHSRIQSYCAKLDPEKDKITFFSDDNIKYMTLKEFINYVNSSIDLDYDITSINIATHKGSIISRDWLTINYKNNKISSLQIQNKYYSCIGYYNLQLIWG